MDVGLENHSSCVTHICDDSLYLIFEKLDSKLDRESFGLTCHRFLNIQNTSHKSLDLGRLSRSNCSISDTDSVITDKLLNRFRHLESLSLSCRSKISDLGLTKLRIYGFKLHSLCLAFCPSVTNAGLSSIASGCPLLSVISLSNCSITDSGLEILTKSCKSLIEVNLAWCLDITDRGIQSLNKNCRQLRALKISGCTKIAGVGFQGCTKTLSFLEANYCAFSPMGMSGILSGGGLEYLNLYNLNECVSGHGLAAIGSGIAANLKILNFQACSFFINDAVISISKGCPLLQEWNLSFCDQIFTSGWESIGLHCQNLEIIHVSGCSNLIDHGFLSLANGCKHLSVMYMTNCRGINPSVVHSFMIQRRDVEIINKAETTNFPSWTFTWPFRRCAWL
ncbi:leucine-rich repeat domain, L domain-like protein [Tanacetum coccineum]